MLYSNMVLLTVVTTSNPHTLYFDHPIEKPSYIRLLSASLYNSWHNLKEEAVIYADVNDQRLTRIVQRGRQEPETGHIVLLTVVTTSNPHTLYFKRSHSIVHRAATGLGSLSVILSSGALATALTGVGIVASPALGGVAGVCGMASFGFAEGSKSLNGKVTKHEKIYTLALAKRNSVNALVSKALTDKQISDVEFNIITREVESYHELKAEIRSGVTTTTNDVATQTQAPDLEKLKEELRKEVKIEFQKKVSLLTAVSKSDLNG